MKKIQGQVTGSGQCCDVMLYRTVTSVSFSAFTMLVDDRNHVRHITDVSVIAKHSHSSTTAGRNRNWW